MNLRYKTPIYFESLDVPDGEPVFGETRRGVMFLWAIDLYHEARLIVGA